MTVDYSRPREEITVKPIGERAWELELRIYYPTDVKGFEEILGESYVIRFDPRGVFSWKEVNGITRVRRISWKALGISWGAVRERIFDHGDVEFAKKLMRELGRVEQERRVEVFI